MKYVGAGLHMLAGFYGNQESQCRNDSFKNNSFNSVITVNPLLTRQNNLLGVKDRPHKG